MDRTPTLRRNLKSPMKSDLYSTFVVHGETSESNKEKRCDDEEEEQSDIYATMIYKNDDVGVEVDEEEDDSSLPPLLKRLPKDFGGGSSMDYDNDPISDDYGTVIVKTNRSRKPRDLEYSDFNSSLKKRIETFEDDEDDNDGGFSTFVVKKGRGDDDYESVSGTVVRKTKTGSGSSGYRDSTMRMAVASMQAAGELGFGGGRQQRKGSGGSSQGEDIGRQHSKISSSSMPESITREDPTSKYEVLSELGLFYCV